MLTIILRNSDNIVDWDYKRYWRVNLKEKSQNGSEIYFLMNKKQNGYQNVN